MDSERKAFEAMMNEIGNSDSDSEFEVAEKESPKAAAQGKSKHSEHDYHQSKSSKIEIKHHTQSRNGAKSHDTGPKAHSSVPVSHGVAMPKDKIDTDIENFGAKRAGAPSSSNRNDKKNVESNQHSDFLATKNWLMRACHPHDPTTLCYMIREKSLVGGMTLRLFIEPKNEAGMIAAHIA